MRRRLPEFLSVSSFSVPGQEELLERMSVNLLYYALNYLLLCAALLLVLAVQQPGLLFCFVALSACAYLLFSMRTEALSLAGAALTEPQLQLAFALLSLALLLYVGGSSMLWVSALAALLCLLHAGLRQRSVKSRGSVSLQGAKDAAKSAYGDIKRELRR